MMGYKCDKCLFNQNSSCAMPSHNPQLECKGYVKGKSKLELFLYNIFLTLARKANNGELFNKRMNRDKKDAQTAFFWSFSKKFSPYHTDDSKLAIK